MSCHSCGTVSSSWRRAHKPLVRTLLCTQNTAFKSYGRSACLSIQCVFWVVNDGAKGIWDMNNKWNYIDLIREVKSNPLPCRCSPRLEWVGLLYRHPAPATRVVIKWSFQSLIWYWTNMYSWFCGIDTKLHTWTLRVHHHHHMRALYRYLEYWPWKLHSPRQIVKSNSNHWVNRMNDIGQEKYCNFAWESCSIRSETLHVACKSSFSGECALLINEKMFLHQIKDS